MSASSKDTKCIICLEEEAFVHCFLSGPSSSPSCSSSSSSFLGAPLRTSVGHGMCKTCVCRYLDTSSVFKRGQLKCLGIECPNILPDVEVIRLIESIFTIERQMKKKDENEIENEDEKGDIDGKGGGPLSRKLMGILLQGARIAATNSYSTDAASAEDVDICALAQRVADDALVLKCPKCKAAYEDFEGCAKLTCHRCKICF